MISRKFARVAGTATALTAGIAAAATLALSAPAGAAVSTSGAGAAAGDMGWLSELGHFASGTDDAPGGLAWVGEQGPELLNLPGGTSVTPNASMRSSGGGDNHYYIDAKGAEIGVEEKIVRALQAAEPRFIGKAITNFSEIQRRTASR